MTDTPTTYLDYARRGKNHWFRWIGAGLLAIVVGVILQFVVIGLAVAGGVTLDHLLNLIEKPSDPIGFFLMTGALFGCFAAGLWLMAWAIQGKRFGDLIGRWRWGAFGAGALVWLVLMVVSSALDWLLQPKGFTVSLSSATTSLAVVAVLGLTVQTFTEEFIFRGWLTQGWLLATKNPIAAAILSGLMFGSVHLSNPDGLISAASATVFGIAASLITIRIGSLSFAYGMHLVNNVWGAVVVVQSNDVFKGAPAIFSQHTTGLDWSDVGIEAVCLALVTTLVYVRTRPPLPKAG
jgi:uncharacterized protein